MSEPTAIDTPPGGPSPGAMLRAAREKQGLHVAALAATIKIPQRKLEALEADRYDELPDITFTRALAMTVCRALKIDAAPVLARLPQAGARGLGNVTGSLNAPYRERPGRTDPADLGIARHPLYWAALLVLMAAIALFFLPTGWWASLMPGASGADALPQAGAASAALPFTLAASAAPAADAAASVAAAPAASQAMVEVVHAAPAPDSGASEAADGAGGVALLRASEASWVEVVDAGGQVLVQRVLQPGESLGLDGKLPFKLKIGNAAATSLVFRGQPVDLAALTRDNVARLELK